MAAAEANTRLCCLLADNLWRSNSVTTRYTQDLAAPLSQILQAQGSTTTKYLYGLDRLAAVAGSARTWYAADALGSVRRTLSDTGTPLGVVTYDPRNF